MADDELILIGIVVIELALILWAAVRVFIYIKNTPYVIKWLNKQDDYKFHKTFLEVAFLVDRWAYVKRLPAINDIICSDPPKDLEERFQQLYSEASYIEHLLCAYCNTVSYADLPQVLHRWFRSLSRETCSDCKAIPKHQECMNLLDSHFTLTDDLEIWSRNYIEHHKFRG